MNTCKKCNEWGVVYAKAGIPNLVEVCPECKGTDGTIRFVDTAREIATKAHAGQYRHDRHGVPTNEAFIHHPKRVSERFDEWPAAQATAWLHDGGEMLPEGHPRYVNRASLERLNIPQSVIAAFEAITRGRGEDYLSYIQRVKINRIARAVKIRDIIDNLASDPSDSMIDRYAYALNVLVRED